MYYLFLIKLRFLYLHVILMMMWFFCTLSFIEKNLKEQVETMMRNRLADKRHRHLEKLLLSNPKEVKRLTELIILEQEVKQLSVRNLSLTQFTIYSA